ncbi:toxin-antitoxin system HicB family antitoxin [Saccharopolyspora mangrovi]|uniref:Toxin-antitoxin system HicB family antitoxin n=1 Tax=Saccharopolyspora mangrovi TaxID=3082379 RepID=A0ABU6A8U7_9PSEU|nr:toxin-antitoxin system HicB family antitoxin [Saccharopolyspora sp. S2-29]MEB3367921.1 toxin-antitoxin system HicB family antitoxin [Saccharopolyspora sp. S2-29]
MDLTPHVDELRRDLAVAAEAGGDQARELAERLTAPLESAARLMLFNALSAAADEITNDLAPGSVEVRLRGGEPGFVVTPPVHTEDVEADPTPAPPPVPEAEDGAMSRINLRLPESLKNRVEEAAAAQHLSVNAWLVRAAAAALDGERPRARPHGKVGQHFTGWVR